MYPQLLPVTPISLFLLSFDSLSLLRCNTNWSDSSETIHSFVVWPEHSPFLSWETIHQDIRFHNFSLPAYTFQDRHFHNTNRSTRPDTRCHSTSENPARWVWGGTSRPARKMLAISNNPAQQPLPRQRWWRSHPHDTPRPWRWARHQHHTLAPRERR